MEFKSKSNLLFLILGCFFVSNAIIAEFIGVKVFSVEDTLGITKFDISLFGIPGLSFNMSAGVLLWPIVFIVTDIINEYFGLKGVRLLSYIAVGLIIYAFIIVFAAIKLAPADFWIMNTASKNPINMNLAFNAIFGQGMWIIVGSITAFLVGQLIDVFIFHQIKKYTGENKLWLRATGSTLVSQFIDSFVVIFIAFYINPNFNWSFNLVMAVGLVGYIYKFLVAICCTPILYLLHFLIDSFLGNDLSKRLVADAAK